MITPALGRATGRAPAMAAARARLWLVALLFALAALGWWSTAERMQGMDDGPWTALGTLGWFLGVWVVMMAAMMFPSLAPTVALYSRMTRDRIAPLAVRRWLPRDLGNRRRGRLRGCLGGGGDSRRCARLGACGPVGGGRDAAGRCRLRAHATQGHSASASAEARSASCSARGARGAPARCRWEPGTAAGAWAVAGR